MTPLDLPALRALYEPATRLPWALSGQGDAPVSCELATVYCTHAPNGVTHIVGDRVFSQKLEDVSTANAALIVAAVNALPALLDRLEAAERAADTVKDDVDEQRRNQSIPDQTCPAIDAIVGDIQRALKAIPRRIASCEAEELRDAMSEIEWALSGVIDRVEGVRAANDALRTLGKDWSAIAQNASDAMRAALATDVVVTSTPEPSHGR